MRLKRRYSYQGSGYQTVRIPKNNGGPRQCQALTVKGQPCQGGAMAGSKFCGPHQSQEAQS